MKKLIFEKENNKKQTNSLDEEESESSENDLKIRFLLFWQKSKSFTWTFLLESESFFLHKLHAWEKCWACQK